MLPQVFGRNVPAGTSQFVPPLRLLSLCNNFCDNSSVNLKLSPDRRERPSAIAQLE
jgi:hypothetical protein